MLVKKIEINDDEVNIMFRIKELPEPQNNASDLDTESRMLQHCCRSIRNMGG